MIEKPRSRIIPNIMNEFSPLENVFLQVLNLFLALLLSSFGGDALKGEEEEGSTEKKKTRLQRLIEWTKKRRKKKSSDEPTKDTDTNMVRISTLNLSTSCCYRYSRYWGKKSTMNSMLRKIMNRFRMRFISAIHAFVKRHFTKIESSRKRIVFYCELGAGDEMVYWSTCIKCSYVISVILLDVMTTVWRKIAC